MALNKVLSDESITDMSTAQTLTLPAGARRMLLQAQGGSIRIRLDGSAATSTTGFVIQDGEVWEHFPCNLDNVSLWASSSTPSAYITYFGQGDY